MGGLDGDEPARTIIEERDREIGLKADVPGPKRSGWGAVPLGQVSAAQLVVAIVYDPFCWRPVFRTAYRGRCHEQDRRKSLSNCTGSLKTTGE